jgi:hypothetical protein
MRYLILLMLSGILISCASCKNRVDVDVCINDWEYSKKFYCENSKDKNKKFYLDYSETRTFICLHRADAEPFYGCNSNSEVDPCISYPEDGGLQCKFSPIYRNYEYTDGYLCLSREDTQTLVRWCQDRNRSKK